MAPMTVRQRVAAWGLPAINLILLAVFFSLDLRDLYFKAVWLGPHNSYGFSALGSATFDTEPLVPASSLNISSLSIGDEVNFTSGWPSFLAQCESLHASPGFFLAARATKCQLGTPPKQTQANDILVVADIRVDAAAWAACKLLYLHRRPPICQENVVTEFFHRYRWSDPIVPTNAVAEPNSDAERELLQLLELISRSYPLSSVVCVEGVFYGGPGEYPSSSIFGCASANVFDAAFVGFHSTAFAELQNELAWLTVDVLNVLGFEFVIRQNCKSSFYSPPSTGDGRLTLRHSTTMNFSSFGHLYILVILIDLILVGAHVRSALETATVLLLPMAGTDNKDDVVSLHRNFTWSILYRSLYRSPPIVVLTILSGLLSWQIQMPNSIIWTWNTDSTGKVHAILSSIRVWMLVICVVHQLWAGVVSFSETAAYRIVKRTFVTTTEVLLIVIIVAVTQQQQTFTIGGDKYAVEGQRLWDADSFPGHQAYSNSFTEDLDYLLSTTAPVLWIVYSPMVTIVGVSLVVVLGWLVVKFVYCSLRHRTGGLIDSDAETEATQTYERLPIEELLRVPIRAMSLVRNGMDLEITGTEQQLYIPPSIYFEFGVILDNDIIRTRRGFLNVIHLKVDVAKYFSPIPSTGSASSVASIPPTATAVHLHRPSSFFGVANSPQSPRQNSQAPLPCSTSGKSMTDAVLATDAVRPPSASGSSASGDTEGRRSLAEAAASPASRSMRRRKSTTELASLDDGF